MGRRTVLLVAAVVVAALGTVMVFLYVKSVDDRATEGQALVEILVAKEDIAAGASLSDALQQTQIDTSRWPSASVPDGAIGNADVLGTKVARTQIHKGEPILEAMLGDKKVTSATGLGDLQTEIALPMGEAQRLEGKLQPEDWVYLYRGDTGDLLLNGRPVKVLQIGNATEPTSSSDDQNGQDQGNQGIVILALSKEDASVIVPLSGNIYFGLAKPPAGAAAGAQS
jgi:pilus assembly protein CpaB